MIAHVRQKFRIYGKKRKKEMNLIFKKGKFGNRDQKQRNAEETGKD